MKDINESAADLKVNKIINGLWQIADLERKNENVSQENFNSILDQYLAKGLSTFDMADHYGSSEIIMGKYHQQLGQDDRLQLLTKWVPKPGKSNREEVKEAVLLAKKRLQTDTIYLLQYHAWNYADPSWIDQLFWLDELRIEGHIKHIGLTNVDAAHLKMILDTGIPIRSNQISFSLLDQRAANKMLNICIEYGVKLLAFGTLGGGFLSEKWVDKPEPRIEELQTWSQMKYKRYIDYIGGWSLYQDVLKQLTVIAKGLNCSVANLATGYILNQPGVESVIIGTRLTSNKYIDENLKIQNLKFPQETLNQIANVLSLFKTLPGNCGDEYRKPPYLTAAGDLSDHLEKLPKPYLVETRDNNIKIVKTGTPWESIASYSRAVMSDNRIHVSGTTATHGNISIGGADPYSQTHFIIDKILGVLQSFGTDLKNVIRSRIFIKNKNDWEAVSRAHGERFRGIDPANTLVQADLIGDAYLVEIEVEAIL